MEKMVVALNPLLLAGGGWAGSGEVAMKVKDVIRLLEEEGWFLVATRGSHLEQYSEAVRTEGVT
jgi:hypothetical protein